MHTSRQVFAPPLSPQTFYILLAIFDQPLHGYAIMQRVTQDSAGSVIMPSGTMYSAITRLLNEKLIEEFPSHTPIHPGKPRHTYRITNFGKLRFEQEVHRLKRAALAGHQQLYGPKAWRIM